MTSSSVAPQPAANSAQDQKRRALLAPRLLGSPARWIALVLGVIVLLAFFFTASDRWMIVVNYALIAALAALALNVLSGYAGQISLGIAFFMAIGAYTAAFLGGEPPSSPSAPLGLGLSFVIWLPAAGIVAALIGALVGPTALRLKGFYLGIVSLGLVFIGLHLFKNVRAFTAISGGARGRGFPAPTIGDFSFGQQNDIGFGVALTPHQEYFLLLVPILAVCGLFVANVMRSRAGRAMQAVRDNETAAAIMGVNIFQAKMGAFILSAFLAGVAGALYASYARYVLPDYWDLVLSIQFVAAIIIGGVASVWGSILGAAFVFALPQVIDALSLLPQSSSSQGLHSGDLSAIIYSVLIILFLLFQPNGIVGLLRRGRFEPRLPFRRKGGESASTTNAAAS
jgi:branched-chain amino acid transport system permease protein